MSHDAPLSNASPKVTGGPPEARMIARGRDWSAFEYVCTSGPDDRPFEERHEHFTIAAVVAGTFTYKCDAGKGLLHSGSVLLGNFGRCFECGHDHSRGDRCVALHLAPALFGEVAASVAGMARYGFPAAMLSDSSDLAVMVANLQSAAAERSSLLNETAVISIAEKVLAKTSGHAAAPGAVSARDERRMSEALHYMEDNSRRPVSLDELAGSANMSKFHFLRIFRRVTGTSPYHFLLNYRMRQVAMRLATSHEPVSALAYDAGFGDLSTFNNRFRKVFGVSPRAYRKLR